MKDQIIEKKLKEYFGLRRLAEEKDLIKDLKDAISSYEENLREKISEMIIKDDQIIAETPEHKFGRGMVNSALQEILALIK